MAAILGSLLIISIIYNALLHYQLRDVNNLADNYTRVIKEKQSQIDDLMETAWERSKENEN